jgi:hypothetical protein
LDRKQEIKYWPRAEIHRETLLFDVQRNIIYYSRNCTFESQLNG